MGLRVASAAMNLFSAMWLPMAVFTFWQDIFIVGLAGDVRMYLQVTLSAFHVSMHGSGGTKKLCYGWVALHAFLGWHFFGDLGIQRCETRRRSVSKALLWYRAQGQQKKNT